MLYRSVRALPLAGSITSGLRGFFIGKQGAVRLTTSRVALSLGLAATIRAEAGLHGTVVHVTLMPWIESERLSVQWGFLFDSLTCVMLRVVRTVSTLVHLYSIEYMRHDPHHQRFMSYLSLFTFFMLILITADNYLQMFVGWEGVGLCSYLLINFWSTRLQANKAAIKAMLVNRVGDVGLALGMCAIYLVFHSLDYATVFSCAAALSSTHVSILAGLLNPSALDLIGILLFIGAVGKSAQLGLHTWLPDAMEGPTPVSALIHAATMVTAGVFLIARSSPLLEHSSLALSVITIVGAMTAFFAGMIGLVQHDLKRVIAYSTCSQLGYMVFVCGLSEYSVGVFHLSNHAVFKALLFLSAGSVIHAMADEQDMRRMGGLSQILPMTYATMWIGSIALMGFPFLTGFYSKDVILEIAFGSYSLPGHFAHTLGTLGAFCTAFYSVRLLYLTFLAAPAAQRSVVEHSHDSPILMAAPLLILAIGSLLVGWATKDMRIGVGTDFWGNALWVHPNHVVLLDAEFLPAFIKLIPVLLSVAAGALALVMYDRYGKVRLDVKLSNLLLYVFLNRKWFFDKVYNEYIAQSALHHGYHTTYKRMDRGLIERLGPEGISNFVYARSGDTARIHTGSVVLSVSLGLLGALLMVRTVVAPFFLYA